MIIANAMMRWQDLRKTLFGKERGVFQKVKATLTRLLLFVLFGQHLNHT